jgi:peptide chain release factor 2
MAAPSFWDDPTQQQGTLKKRSRLEEKLNTIQHLNQMLEDASVLLQLGKEGEKVEKDLKKNLASLKKEVEHTELKVMLSGENDYSNAILTIHPGAGGTESQDWASMLMRMYLRWSEQKGFGTEIIDLQPGEEAGIKSSTIRIIGEYAYGLLKAEVGVHRLVRISPFDASNRRHTSFASIFVYPEIDEDIEVNIEEKDLKIDTFRSSGPGGQHVNVTDSAVRITHIPTGIVVQCQNERSQHRNKAMAMMVLRSRLYERARQERIKEQQKLEDSKKEIAWGSQIRSYTLQPYQLIKDHRTGVEIGDVQKVLDGDLEPFIQAYLLSSSINRSKEDFNNNKH